MRKKDAMLFTDSLVEIMASRPDVLDSVTEYFKTCKQMKADAIKDFGKFSHDTYRDVVELMRKNADVKGFILEIVKLVDKLDFLAEAGLFFFAQSLKQGKTKEVIETIDEYFENMVFLEITHLDNENNNEDSGR